MTMTTPSNAMMTSAAVTETSIDSHKPMQQMVEPTAPMMTVNAPPASQGDVELLPMHKMLSSHNRNSGVVVMVDDTDNTGDSSAMLAADEA